MAKQRKPKREAGGKEVLAARLRREADEMRSEFSETLHRRILKAIEERGAAPSAAIRPRPVRCRLAVAAALIAVLLLSYHVFVPQPAPPDQPAASATLADLASLAGLTERAASFVRSSVTTAPPAETWRHIDHDARAIADLLTECLPLDMLSR